MRKSVRMMLLGAAGVSLMLGGCNNGQGAGDNGDGVKQAIKADEAKWNKDFNAKDTEGLAGH